MNILFLDFDGVLNSLNDVAHCGGLAINPEKLALLKQILDATDAKLVLTTSWREHWEKDPALCTATGREICRQFSAYGMEIWDKTSVLKDRREQEIRAWLDSHPEVTRFAVLDDRLLSADFLQGHFVKTSNYFGGLNDADVKQVMEILSGR